MISHWLNLQISYRIIFTLLPGGSGPPLGRHDDRSPRSSVDSRQATTGNTRRAGSQETRELELSQRRMRSPWRVPRRSAERRAARDTGRCRAAIECATSRHSSECADMDGAPIGAPPPFRGGISVRGSFARLGCGRTARMIVPARAVAFHLSPHAGRGRGSEATEGEGASPRF